MNTTNKTAVLNKCIVCLGTRDGSTIEGLCKCPTTNKTAVEGAVDMERHKTAQAIKAICDIEGFNLHQMVTYIVDQRTQAHQQGVRAGVERCRKIVDEFTFTCSACVEGEDKSRLTGLHTLTCDYNLYLKKALQEPLTK